jgi:hypothetical protein
MRVWLMKRGRRRDEGGVDMNWLLSNKADTHVHIFTSNESELRKEMKESQVMFCLSSIKSYFSCSY